MSKFSIILGSLGLLSLALTLVAQQPEEPAPIPKAEPIEKRDSSTDEPAAEDEITDDPEPIDLDELDVDDLRLLADFFPVEDLPEDLAMAAFLLAISRCRVCRLGAAVEDAACCCCCCCC